MEDLCRPSQRLTVPSTELNVDSPNRKKYLKNGIPEIPQTNILGRGSYGTVIKASYKGENVAVKMLKNTARGKMQSVHSEANVCGWDHENIIKILKVESTEDFGFIIMERFNGPCIQGVLDGIQLPLLHRIYISLDIINALNYCHSRQILHLDVKPQNVLVSFQFSSSNNPITSQNRTRPSRKYICKLCDFGSSMKFDEIDTFKTNGKGTIRYMSPEALKDQTLTPASDIYSFAITLWQLKEQKIPYSWLPSNEVVLYKVVKNFLRPDANDNSNTLNIHNSLQQHKNCICQHYDTDSVKIPFQNIENIITYATKSLSPFKQTNRNISKNINNNLQSKFSGLLQQCNGNHSPVVRSSKVEIKITTDENMPPANVDLKTIFMNHNQTETNMLSTEAKFKSLYKACWDDCPETRYAGAQIKNILSDILIKLF